MIYNNERDPNVIQWEKEQDVIQREKEQVKKRAAVITGILKTIGEILQAGPTPAGTLYAGLMQYGCNLQTFTAIKEAFISAGKVKEVNNMLYWIN